MTRLALFFLLTAIISISALGQTPSPSDKTDLVTLDLLSKKIDLENAKIDALSQQILKLEQRISTIRPGVMIGDSTTTTATTAAASDLTKPVQIGNTHVVAKGETLTSIAKMHKVTIEELQKLNHIENDRKLQIGQTIMIPSSSTGPTSPTPTPGS